MATEADAAIDAVGEVLPFVLNLVGSFFPTLKPIIPVITQVLPAALSGVKTVIDQTGASPTQAAAAVAAHLTPGLPNSPALSPAGH
jgi:phage-related protein